MNRRLDDMIPPHPLLGYPAAIRFPSKHEKTKRRHQKGAPYKRSPIRIDVTLAVPMRLLATKNFLPSAIEVPEAMPARVDVPMATTLLLLELPRFVTGSVHANQKAPRIQAAL